MTNQRHIVLATLALLLFAAGVVRAEKPNFIIIFADDQGYGDLSCFGSKTIQTPNIDRLARSGLRFTQAYAHTVCCPARAALLTGRHPQRGGVNSWTQGDMRGEPGINMDLEEVTLAEALRPAGYRSALFGKWHLSSDPVGGFGAPNDLGWSHFEGSLHNLCGRDSVDYYDYHHEMMMLFYNS